MSIMSNQSDNHDKLHILVCIGHTIWLLTVADVTFACQDSSCCQLNWAW